MVVGLFGGVQCVVVLGFWLGCLLAGPVLVYLSFFGKLYRLFLGLEEVFSCVSQVGIFLGLGCL